MNKKLNLFGPNRQKPDSIEHQASPSSTKTQQHGSITWTDIEDPTDRDIQKLAKEYPFHPLHLEASLREDSLPQQEREAKYLFLLLHIPILDKTRNKTIASRVAIFLGKDYLITIHSAATSAIRKQFDACEQDKGQRDDYFQRSAGYLLYKFLKNLLNHIAGQVRVVLKELDQTEDMVFDTIKSDASAIAILRQKILKLRRTTAPLKTVLTDLVVGVHNLTKEKLSHHYRDIAREANWLSEMTEEAEETIEIYKDADFTASTERTNQILAVLTIVFTLAIPATVFGTFYGMNIPLPGGIEVGAWNFLGPYTTLIVILIASFTPGAMMYWYFRRRHWF